MGLLLEGHHKEVTWYDAESPGDFDHFLVQLCKQDCRP